MSNRSTVVLPERADAAAPNEPAADAGRQGRRNTLDDVLRVGAEIIAAKGFREASIRDIADALGITKSTLYHHVESKDHLLFAIISSYQSRGRRMIDLARTAGPDPRDSLSAFIRELVGMNASDTVMATLLARELRSLKGDHSKEVMTLRDEYETFVRSIILSGQATGTFRKDVDARLATISVFALANSLHQWYRPDGLYAAKEVADSFSKIILQGLAAQSASA